MHRIGIDLGGTKIAGIALDPTGKAVAEGRIATPREDYPGTLAAITGLVADLERQAGVPMGSASVGIGMPGALSLKSGLVKNANSTWLNGQRFDRDLSSELGRPVRLANDANCLAVSEATDGAGRGAHLVFAVILGTGVGGGIAIDGAPLTGPQRDRRRMGAQSASVAQDGRTARSPPAIAGSGAVLRLGYPARDWLPNIGVSMGRSWTVTALSRRQRPATRPAAATLVRWRERLARSLSVVVNLLDPDVIVIGGGLSRIENLYQPLPDLLSTWCFSDGISTPVRPALHGDASGVRGAAGCGRQIPEISDDHSLHPSGLSRP